MPSCFMCDESYGGKALLLHFKIKHKLQPLLDAVKCKECGQKFASMKNILKHFKTCPKNTIQKSLMKRAAEVVGESSNFHSQVRSSHDDTVNKSCMTDMESDSWVSDNVGMLDSSNPAADVSAYINEETAVFMGKLYSHVALPRKTIQTVVDGAIDLFDSTFHALKERLNVVAPELSSSEEVQLLLESLSNPFGSLETDYKRLKYFEERGTYIPPFEFSLGAQRTDQKYVNGEAVRVPIPLTGQFISPRKVLAKLLSEPALLQETLEYNRKLVSSDSSLLSNFIQGEFWRNKLKAHEGKIIFPIFIYMDEFECNNPLGAFAGVHKLCGVYMTLPCIPPRLRSKLAYIFVVLLFHSDDRKECGNKAVFRLLIKELNELAREGIPFKTDVFTGTIYFHLGLLQGDNLGVHQMTGFAESFNATFPCRLCSINRKNLSDVLIEDPTLLRTQESYDRDVAINDLSKTGINSHSIWNEVDGCHVTTSVAVDSMHDLLEGMCHYDMTIILRHFIFDKKYFTLEQFNVRLLSFDFGLIDKRNKPPAQSRADLDKDKLKMTAISMLVFCKYFGVIYGDLIQDEEDEHWQLYLGLRSILDIVLSRNLQAECEIQLKILIRDHHLLYLKCSNGNLKPKFHHLIHYPRLLRLLGPFNNMWNIRLEAKHKTSKLIATSVTTRKNLCSTTAKRLQLALNWFFMSREKNNENVQPGPGHLISVNQLSNFEHVQNDVPLNFKEVFVCQWVSVDSTEYKPKMLLIYDYCDSSPLFAMIEQVFVHNSSSVHFICSKFDTLYLDSFFAAYCVRPCPDKFIFLSQSNLFYEQPHCLSRGHDGRSFVTLMGL